jgi:hypothetical protein
MCKDRSAGVWLPYKEACLGVWNEEGVAHVVIKFLYDFGFLIGFYNVGMITTAPKTAITNKHKLKVKSDIIF